MAGRGRTTAILDSLDRRRRAHFELASWDTPDEATQSILVFVSEYLANGNLSKDLALSLTTELGFEVWPSTVSRVISEQYGKGATESAFRTARVHASHLFAEESVDIVDRADDSSGPAVSKASARARSRQWLAGKWNRGDYGDDKSVSVNVLSVGSLHLDALRSEHARVTGALPSADPVTISDGQAATQAVVLPALTSQPTS